MDGVPEKTIVLGTHTFLTRHSVPEGHGGGYLAESKKTKLTLTAKKEAVPDKDCDKSKVDFAQCGPYHEVHRARSHAPTPRGEISGGQTKFEHTRARPQDYQCNLVVGIIVRQNQNGFPKDIDEDACLQELGAKT